MNRVNIDDIAPSIKTVIASVLVVSKLRKVEIPPQTASEAMMSIARLKNFKFEVS